MLLNLLMALSVSFLSCKKDSGNQNAAPRDLMVTATVSSDNSGNVSFSASAVNAVSFEFNFGNGNSQTSAFGVLVYQYPAAGTYTVTVTARSASGQSISKTIQVTISLGYTLVWSDEFDNSGSPDPSKWDYDLGDGCPSLCGWGNNELQNYTNRPENVTVSNGTLKIIARKESYNGSAYTSARLKTQNKYSFKYGKVEVKAKLPAGVGTWPAIWMLGNNINTVGWPACGEIDIMEHRGSHLNTISAALHYPGRSGGNAEFSTVNINNVTSAFHRYTVEWNSATIKFSVDDVPFFTVANSASLPFNHNFFILLNVAMGGNYGGPVDPAFTSAVMEIDYVRVYQ